MTAGVDDAELADGATAGLSRVRFILATCACATGGALILHITSRVSLALTAATLLVLAVVVFSLVLRRIDPIRRAEVFRRVRVGAGAGLLATLAYDVSRYGVVSLLELSFKPFHAFELFGKGLLGADVSGAPALLAGTTFHLANGTGFGIAFALLVRRPNIVKGIAWAMFLEAAMVIFYPSWLQPKAMGEFLEVSVLGHAVYGIVLGTLTRRWLHTSERS